MSLLACSLEGVGVKANLDNVTINITFLLLNNLPNCEHIASQIKLLNPLGYSFVLVDKYKDQMAIESPYFKETEDGIEERSFEGKIELFFF